MRKLENKTVFITGGLSGIGKEGANTAIADRLRNTSRAAMNEIKDIQPNAIHIECNVSIYADVAEAITQTAATEGIRINAICPGFITTPLLDKLELTKNNAVKKPLCEMHPMNRLGNAEEYSQRLYFSGMRR